MYYRVSKRVARALFNNGVWIMFLPPGEDPNKGGCETSFFHKSFSDFDIITDRVRYYRNNPKKGKTIHYYIESEV